MRDYWFGKSGGMRSGIGIQVAIIAASFGLDVEDGLAQTLPSPNEHAEERRLSCVVRTRDQLQLRVDLDAEALEAQEPLDIRTIYIHGSTCVLRPSSSRLRSIRRRSKSSKFIKFVGSSFELGIHGRFDDSCCAGINGVIDRNLPEFGARWF